MFSIKNYLYKCSFGAIVAVACFASSCRKQLETPPESFLTPDQLYKDEAGAIAGVTGVYRLMMEWKRSDYYFLGEVGTDEGKTSSFVPSWGGYWQHYAGVNSYNTLFSSQNDLILGLWSTLYKGIGNANVAIRYIPGAAATDAVKNRLLAETKFLRASFYFTLVQFFGSIPLPTEQPDEVAAAKGGRPKSSEADVYALITADLQFAAANLLTKSATQVGRANKEAAITLLGKVQLTRKLYTDAKNTLEPLMTPPAGVGLMDNYADLFKEDNENNKESLYEIQFSNEKNNTNSLASALGGWHIANTYSGGGGQVIVATDYYSNGFESNTDTRRDASLRYVFYDANGNLVDYSWWADVGKPHVKKYDITQGKSLNGSESSRNVYYLRYADAVLMYAEAQNELGKADIALEYLNKIRNRALLPKWEIVLGHTPTAAELRPELLKERMRELGFEGWRWFDLERTGNLLTQVKAYNADATPNMVEKHQLFPIPTAEFEANQSLKKTDQNPGY
jgi:hypothetical protein